MKAFVNFNTTSGLSEFVTPTEATALPDPLPLEFPAGTELLDNLPDTDGLLYKESNGNIRLATQQDIDCHSICIQTLNDAKSQKIAKLRNECTQIIYSTYPVFDQLVIMRKGGQPLSDMDIWIDDYISQRDTHETTINALTTSLGVANYSVTWDTPT